MNDGPGSMLAPGGAGSHDAGHRARGTRRAALWWALLVVPLWIVLVVCTHWEPVMRDGWGHVVWLRNHALHGGPGLYDFARECYLQENPRLGQIPTLLLYARGPYHAVITPVLELAVLALLTAHALGRWPSLRRTDDALAAALVTAILAACVPQIGPMLFYRPFTWNYVFGLGLNLWWLLPYRREVAGAPPAGALRAPAVFALGVAAGLCNEHTGPAFAAMAALACLVAWRRGALRAWMIAGFVGLVAGYAVLLTAPAQHVRYGALAQQASIVGRIADRGVIGNLEVLGRLGLALAPALPLVVIGLVLWLVQRAGPAAGAAGGAAGGAGRAAAGAAGGAGAVPDRASHAVLALAGLACTLTLLASPKLGPRLYFASVALIAAGLTGWLIGRLAVPGVRRGFTLLVAGLAAGTLVFVCARLVAIHRVVGPRGAAREELVEQSRIGSVVTVPRFSTGVSRYFLGDDLLVPPARELLAREWGLVAIELDGAEP